MMSFSCSKLIQIPQKNMKEQVSEQQNVFTKPPVFFTGKRMSLLITPVKASITIESALALPIYIFCLITLIMVMDAVTLSTCIQKVLHQEAKLLAIQAYSNPQINEADAFQKIRDELNRQNIIEEIDFSQSQILDSEVIDLIAVYHLKFPYDIFQIGEIPMMERALTHKWTGYRIPFDVTHQNQEENYVFITPNGTVYHFTKECTHLKLKIRKTTVSQVKKERNRYGARYQPCEKCYRGNVSSIYLAETGDRYHSSINCSGLKRTILTIRLSEVGGRRPCSRCQ